MTLKLNLNKLRGRLALAILALAGSSLLAVIIISRFVIGTLADGRLLVTRDMLQVPVGYFPNSARLNARLASAELSESDRDLANAKAHAQRAVDLSPNDHRFRIILASVEEAEGDRAAAETSLEAARALAPNYWSVHYRLGNLLVREGKLAQSLEEFRIAVAANSALLPGTLDLLWRASRGDVNAVRIVAGTSSKARLTLAQFLLKVSRPAEAASVFGSIDRAGRLASSAGRLGLFELAHRRRRVRTGPRLVERDGRRRPPIDVSVERRFRIGPLEGFRSVRLVVWPERYARFSIDAAVAHSGSRSLRIESVGRDTTQLDNEIRQLVTVRPGARYSLECYAKASELETPEGPRVVVSNSASPAWIAASEPVARVQTFIRHQCAFSRRMIFHEASPR